MARMTKEGFEHTASKEDLMEVKGEVSGLKDEMKEVVKRLDRIEYGMISHERRLSILEDKMRIVSVKIGLKK